LATSLSAVAETSNVQDYVSSQFANDVMTTDEEQSNNVVVPTKFKPYPFSYHTELVVRIESLTNLGFGIARVELDDDDNLQRKEGNIISHKENNEGHDDDDVAAINKKKKWVIFVPNVIPDELVKVRIYRNFASYSDADLLQIIEPSLDRIDPICSLATVCGGCQYQHISISKQRQMKTLQVQELFEKLGGLSPTDFPAVLDTIGTNEIYGYRSKITPHYDAPLKKKTQPKECTIGPIGFKEKASHRIVDVPHCFIATSTINNALQEIRNNIREQAQLGLLKKPTKGATLLLRDSNNGDVVETNHTAYVLTTVNNLTFRFQAGNFFQNNPYMLPIMVDLVVNAATQVSRTTGQTMTHLIDCYCGSGLFCIASSSKFNVCVGIEVNEKAIEEARYNALLNGIHNCDFVAASAEAIFMSKEPVRIAGDGDGVELLVADFPRERTVVVLDPPRKGCSEEFMAQLHDFQPARVVYMSCDPSTQARDAKLLLSYGYEIVSIQPFDLFPQTRHIECLAIFEKKL
jgi:23S rRNA (uracil1939-C5)-methyltransferase/tRNA (uracil-5-)-methyltransferase